MRRGNTVSYLKANTVMGNSDEKDKDKDKDNVTGVTNESQIVTNPSRDKITEETTDEKSKNEEQAKGAQEKEISIVDNLKSVNSLIDSEVKQKLVQKIGEGSDTELKYDVRAADQAEEERDFVKLKNIVKFFVRELNLTRASDELRLYDLLEVILI